MRLSIWHAVPLLFIVACGGQSASDDPAGGSAGTGATGATGATGGVSSGGAGAVPGTGGAGAGGSGGGGGTAPECTVDTDCKLFSDCCTCEALPKNHPDPPSCDLACIQDSCSALGIGKAVCSAGQCVASVECDPKEAMCFSLPPTCPSGQVPTVVQGCWGGCIDATQCRSVGDCAACSGPNQACVRYDLQGGEGPESTHCVDIPKACNGDASCACMGQSVCTNPYVACQDFSGIKGVSCSCPNC